MVSGKGRRRPTDWQPLAEKDPIPGDPEDIRDEVTKMKNLAKTLRDQARILRKAEDGDALQGNYADKIREKSGELDKRFRETAGRYERVVGDLGKWADDLEDFQERADRILRSAKHADEEHAADVKKKAAEAKKDGDEPPEDSDSDSHLATYRRQLDDVISERDTRARQYANNLGDDISDVLEDSAWENFADGLSTTLDVIGYIATAIAVIAIFCTPAGWLAGLLTGLAIGLGVASLAGHTLLAATGEGSWTDVAFDAIGLATMGLGSKALTALKAGRAVTKTAATSAAKVQKGRQLMERSKNVRKLLDRNMSRHGLNSSRGQTALRAKERQIAKIAREMRAAKQAEANAPVAHSQGIVEKEARDLAADVKRMNKAFGGEDTTVANAAKGAESEYTKFKMYWGAGTGLDAGDKLVDNIASLADYDGYGDLKDVPTLEVGSQY
ncbi:putative T7SS-secreted protein [Streptomyces sp. MS1.AVA.3]|uniref:putative T7SS-secreted protein n=1 Tax=Streptomyces decoyicus TaxID=249567 RepID=UPI0030BD9A3B